MLKVPWLRNSPLKWIPFARERDSALRELEIGPWGRVSGQIGECRQLRDQVLLLEAGGAVAFMLSVRDQCILGPVTGRRL